MVRERRCFPALVHGVGRANAVSVDIADVFELTARSSLLWWRCVGSTVVFSPCIHRAGHRTCVHHWQTWMQVMAGHVHRRGWRHFLLPRYGLRQESCGPRSRLERRRARGLNIGTSRVAASCWGYRRSGRGSHGRACCWYRSRPCGMPGRGGPSRASAAFAAPRSSPCWIHSPLTSRRGAVWWRPAPKPACGDRRGGSERTVFWADCSRAEKGDARLLG